MNKLWLSGFAFLAMTIGVSLAKAQTPSDKSVIRLDPSLDSLLSSDAKLELVKGGFGSTEGPNWVQKGKNGFLIFSDMPANVINKMTSDGKVSIFLEHSGYSGPQDGTPGSDGLTFDPQGRLVICTWGGRTIDRIEKNGKRVVLADNFEGKRFGGTNDAIVKNDGAIYFSDKQFFGGKREKGRDPQKDLDFEGIYMIRGGKVTLAVKDIPTPNGLAFSPDEKYFYANSSATNYIKRYDVQPDDTLTNGKMFIDLSEDKTPGFTDGMRVDSKGNIYTSGPGGVWIITPAGKHIGTILVPERVANLAFGDSDYKTVYLTASKGIYKIRVLTPGHHR